MRNTACIQRAGNFMVIKDYPPEFVRVVIRPFCRRYLYKLGKVPIPGTRKSKTVVTHVFARMNNDQTEVRMSIGLFDDLVRFIGECGYDKSRLKIEELPIIKPVKVDFEWAPGWGEPRENQADWVEYQSQPGQVKVNNAQTGQGKTFMATHTMVNQGERTFVSALPKYAGVWVDNFAEKLVLKPEDVVLVETSELETLAENIYNGVLNPKIVIIPLTRIMIYLDRTREDNTLPCLDTIYEMCGFGLRIMDESHESLHQVYISMLNGNFKKTIALSATLKADDAMKNQIYGYIFPKKIRLKEPEYRKYIEVYAYWHSINTDRFRLRTKGFGGYSHMLFEKSIMKTPILFNHYAELTVKAFREFYLEHKDYQPDQKVLFFFYTVEMCKRMMEYFKTVFPDDDIVKYTNEESKNKDLTDSYKEHAFVFTTAKSCGTGKDIPKLFVVICPLSVSSTEQNNQMLGRLRDVQKWWPGLNPKYVFFVCGDIEKQREYADKRKQCFADKSLSYTNINSGMRI